jgi:hypothetical protein
MTYMAHAIMALVALAAGAVLMFMKLGIMDSGSGQAWATLIGMFAVIPLALSSLIAAYSAIVAVITLFRRQRPPRDMLLLPIGLVVSIAGGSVLADLGSWTWTIVAYLLLASYIVMTLTLGLRYQRSRAKGSSSFQA